MGGAIAERLVGCGVTVRGYDLSESARERLGDIGGESATTVAEAVHDADFVITSLPNSEIVRSVWLDPEGVVAHAQHGAALIEMSTIDPTTMISVAEAARAVGLAVFDCPVTGSPSNARAGTLGILAGADPGTLDVARPLLELIGPILEAGLIGAAKVVKIVNNMMSMGNMWVAAEAFAVGVTAGVDPTRLYEILKVGGGRSNQFEKHFQRAIARDYTPSFSIDLARKDLALALDLCRSLDVPAPAASGAHSIYSMAIAEGLTGLDKLAVYQLYHDWATKARTPN
jgi:3-hydroxyisobutyrate dehydrogenase